MPKVWFAFLISFFLIHAAIVVAAHGIIATHCVIVVAHRGVTDIAHHGSITVISHHVIILHVACQHLSFQVCHAHSTLSMHPPAATLSNTTPM
jgi:hypothetical protein